MAQLRLLKTRALEINEHIHVKDFSGPSNTDQLQH